MEEKDTVVDDLNAWAEQHARRPSNNSNTIPKQSSMLSSDDGSHMSSHDVGAHPAFVVILEDKDFTTKAGVLSTHRGSTRAEVIQGKIHRKTGSCRVISLTDANSEDWLRMLYPSPTIHMIYHRHPCDANRYLGIKIFHSTILHEKRNDLTSLFRCLGARSIVWDAAPTFNRTYEAPDTMVPYIDSPEQFLFLASSPSWQHMIEERLNNWTESISFDFVYDNDYSVSDALMDKVLDKMNVEHVERVALYGYPSGPHRRSSKSQTTDNDTIFFRPITDIVKVTFFTKHDYFEHNRVYITNHWDNLHVLALLHVGNIPKYKRQFRQLQTTFDTLFSFSDPSQLMQYANMTSADAAGFFLLLSSLGSVDAMHIVEAVMQQVQVLRGEVEIAATSTSTTPTISAQQSGHSTSVDNVVPRIDAPPVTLDTGVSKEGTYTVALVGTSAVGKSSILRQLLYHTFDPNQAPTSGAQLLQHVLGLAALSIWDTAGQATQHRGVLMHTKKADVIMVVYDVTSRRSFDIVVEVVADILRNGTVPWVSLVLLGNKVDLLEERREREVTFEDAILFARKYNFSNFFETSAKTGLNIAVSLTNALLSAEQNRLMHMSEVRDSGFQVVEPVNSSAKNDGCC